MVESMNVANAKDFLKDNPGYLKWGYGKLSEKLGLSISMVRDIVHTVKVDMAIETESHNVSIGGAPPINAIGGNVYDQFLADRGIDPDDVVSVKHWQNMGGEPRFSVVTKDNNVVGEAQMEEILEERLSKYVVPEFIPPPPVGGEKGVVFNMYDAHIDKISIASEVYDATDFTIDDSFENLEMRFDEVLAGVAAHNPETIFFPVGSDFWSTNGTMSTTKKGTPQRTLAPHEEVFDRGVSFYMDCINKMLQVSQNVVVITTKGNHDMDPVFYLGVALKIAFRDQDRVQVHSTRHQRKYFQYGQWGFGFGHGDNEKRHMDRMPLWFAQEGKEIWYRTEMHEFFLGDIHHKEEYKFKRAYDGVGMTAYFLRSTNGVDAWHSDCGWIGIPKEISAFVYHRSSGRRNVVSVSW